MQVTSTSQNALSSEERLRYARHFTLPEVGEEGQRKLKGSSVLVVGAGGLGAPLSLYLAAAGVGRIGIVDFDLVETSNLQRQVLYATADAGRPKLDAASERLRALNPNVVIELHDVRLTRENALDIIGDYDVVADGSDNFATRYLVNDACILTRTPNVYGSIYQFEGQVSVFCTDSGPSYRCVFPEPPPPGTVPSCAEGGVLGVLPGIVGSIQAAEVLKLLAGAGELLIGRLLLIDALSMRFRTLEVSRNPDWPPAAPHPTVTKLIDYEDFCSMPFFRKSSAPLITVDELSERMKNGNTPFILDVRRPSEYDADNMGGTLIPLNELPERVEELAPHRDEEIVVHCQSGGRSAKAAEWLRSQGFENVYNLKGGLKEWRKAN